MPGAEAVSVPSQREQLAHALHTRLVAALVGIDAAYEKLYTLKDRAEYGRGTVWLARERTTKYQVGDGARAGGRQSCGRVGGTTRRARPLNRMVCERSRLRRQLLSEKLR